jgi:hypothetical protein
MFADKSNKSDKKAQKVSTANKPQKRKPTSIKPVQRAVALTNTLLTEADVAQFKKNAGKHSLIGLLNTKPVQMKQKNSTGMPDQLKAGVESLAGMDMSDVRVHYNSDKPAHVGALAYTQGRDIHVASGQEKHLAHEAWHVVQQAQGRVQPTMQLQGVKVNDNPGLEHEADVMGAKAHNYTGNGE